MDVDVGRGEAFVSEPQSDNSGVEPRRAATAWRRCGVAYAG